MYTVKIAGIDEFRDSKEKWNALASAMSYPSIFCTWEWIYTWWEHFGDKYRPLILFIYHHAELVGILPLASCGTKLKKGCLTGRVLSYCGSMELYPDHLDIISSGKHAPQCLSAAFHFLATKYKRWDVCHLGLSTQRSNFMTWLEKNRDNDNFPFDLALKKADIARFISISGSFDDYITRFDKKQRYNLRSRRKKLYDEHGFAYTPCDPLKEPRYLDILFDLHSLRSNKKRIRSRFISPRIIEFHKSLVRRIGDKGWLSFRALQNEKDVIAVSYNFFYEGRMFSYQKGLDPRWERYGPGKTILYEAIQETFLNGGTEYNLLQGDEEYKSLWADNYRSLFDINICRKTPGGVVSRNLVHLKYFVKAKLNKPPAIGT